MSVTARAIIGSAFQVVGLYMPGETPSAADEAVGLRWLNSLVGQWAQTNVTIPVVAREVFDLVANKGGPSNPYTIGTGANLNTARPPNQNNLVGAALLLTTPAPDVEVPLSVVTDGEYARIAIKELTNSQPTIVYYSPTFTTSLFGTINLWPVPDNATNDLVLYLEKALVEFADLTTAYEVPPSYTEAFDLNLAKRLSVIYPQTQPVPGLDGLAREAFATMARSNVKLLDVRNDLTNDRRGGFNIESGTGG